MEQKVDRNRPSRSHSLRYTGNERDGVSRPRPRQEDGSMYSESSRLYIENTGRLSPSEQKWRNASLTHKTIRSF